MTDSEHDDADDPLVVPPGGPRPARDVHPVPPGHRVRQLADGSFVVEPDPCAADSQDDEEDEDR